MKPKQPQDLYKITASKLNLPEEYVKDVVEYFYMYNKNKMFNLSYVIFNFSGLGRFVVRPITFSKRSWKLLTLIEKFKSRKDDRGIAIKIELEKRYSQFKALTPAVQDYFDYRQKQMYKNNKNGFIKRLEKQT